jgi:putative ABC transport system permease protein
MRLRVIFHTAFRALRRNMMRSLLTGLGIIIGVAAVIAMVAIGNGAKAQVEEQIASIGDNVILIFSGSVTRGGMRSGYGGAGTLTLEDAAAIKKEIPTVEAVTPEVSGGVRVSSGGENWSTRLNGVAPEYFDIRRWIFTYGGPFTERDVRTAAKVAVLGDSTATRLFGGPEAALGQIVRIKNVPFTVIGTLAVKGVSVIGSDQDDTVVIPYTSAMKRVLGVKTLPRITLSVEKGEPLAPVLDKVTELLTQRHRIGPDREVDFFVRSQEEIATMATETSRVMTMLLAAIASVSLVVGGIGIMNIMLVSVTERTREIGIRLAVGARGGDILLQFLIEAVTLSLLGGLIGIGVGLGTAKILGSVFHWAIAITPTPIIGSFLCSAAVGIFFGFYPARKAAALDPIEALRYE